LNVVLFVDSLCENENGKPQIEMKKQKSKRNVIDRRADL